MGATSHKEPYGFSQELSDYLRKILADHGREDLSGRWLEKVTGSARRYDYWKKIVKGVSSLTTNDVQVLADAFGVSPYEFVANARRYKNGQPVAVLSANVGPTEEDIDRSDFPEAEEQMAAETERKPKPKK